MKAYTAIIDKDAEAWITLLVARHCGRNTHLRRIMRAYLTREWAKKHRIVSDKEMVEYIELLRIAFRITVRKRKPQ